ncbi:MAG: zf-HC2 domain-containing protein [Candidatus Eisenbacteria bacterium]|uniref:Zf-HC2 domain-containing protein n=1 Tax=Eiseniibacteriota bacterium TaxID=2212470 RepID=A0A933SD89_UNCEI|nr:zf-HC2 domain-containing protein [Candidatus Eisenbacteria bacterium]
MSDRWTDALSEYLDGDLAATEARELEQHLESCEECRVTLEELREIRERARSLVDPPAPDDLWAGIASRIGTAGSTSEAPRARVLKFPARVPSIALPWAVAAAFALVTLGAGGAYVALRGAAAPEPGTIAHDTAETGGEVQLASFDAEKVETEIAALQSALDHGRGRLDPKTVLVLEKNLTLIRQATEDAKRALAADPANRDLQNYFAGTVEKKLQLVRRAATMAGV